MAATSTFKLVRISVRGVVQGVGFRPFVYRLAARHRLRGWVGNTSADVRIEAEGEARNIERFLKDLRAKAPPMAHIEDITVTSGSRANYTSFEIRPSLPEEGKYQLVSPDIATCPACLKEIFDPSDRRYRYPFTNCTNCGPRFTIIADIPYDRPNTTMKDFVMCPACRREYDDPQNHRFHAQPNACPVCGPRLELVDAAGQKIECVDIIHQASQLLKEGKIIAVKGLGGFLLACDATSREAVERLRRRKKRPAKPFAVMVASLGEVKKHCYVNREEENLLTSPGSPIVLMRRKRDSTITEAVAPGLKYLGLMLPYTPLHHLLLREKGKPLVMTSGNRSEEPISRDNHEAMEKLDGIADYFLRHNRGIYARYDDSIAMVVRNSPQFIRRARGYAPHPLRLNYQTRQILACGAEEKNTFCLTRDEYAFLSQHIGDMENLETLEHFTDTIELYKKLFRIKPEIIAYDMHPEYLSTKYAQKLAAADRRLKLVPVQHHHAHIAGCMADNGLTSNQVIGVAFDGTGYGTDGRIWGAEFMAADYHGFTRLAHLEYLPLPGGALAIRKPYRTAIGYLTALELDGSRLAFLKKIDPQETNIIKSQIARSINTPLTSSMGRLFDAVSGLLGVRGEILYEAQAAIELEMLAHDAPGETGSYPFAVEKQKEASIIKVRDLFAAIINDLRIGTPKAAIAMKFHHTIVQMILKLCKSIAADTGLKQVVLSGGCFQNRLLLEKAMRLLEDAGFEVFTHRQVPTNDGGIALGQAVIAGFTDTLSKSNPILP